MASEDEAVRDSDPEEKEEFQQMPSKRAKKKGEKTGIIYLSTVPDFMSVQRLRNTFEEYGEINRTFFQPVEKSFAYKKGLLFTEGWVEFKQRSVAKYVTAALNNTQVGGKKRNPWYSCIWNIKYLPKFTWTDVNADRELKTATRESRLRADIAQVKKQTNYYVSNYERSKTLSQIKKGKEKRGETFEKRFFNEGVPQKLTDEEIRAQKKGKREHAGGNDRPGKAKKAKKTFGDNDTDSSQKFVMNNIFGKSS